MRIIITGGAGYKGLKLAPQLLARGHHVTILDNFMYGYDSALFLFNYPNVAFVQKDIRNIAEKDIAKFDIIIHLAGISGYPACESNPNSAQMINVVATQKMVSLLSVNQILINAATTSSYGQSGQECDETTAISPVSLYGVTKYEAEKICMDRENSISLRFATIFGISPRMRWDLLPNDFVMRAMHERSLVLFGSQSVRTFLHIDDAVRSYIMAVERSQDMRGEVYNVGSNSMNYSKKQLAEKIKQYVEFVIIDSSLPDPDVRHFFINF
jgi:nucleoside-diphosphate-sugar epimerase